MDDFSNDAREDRLSQLSVGPRPAPVVNEAYSSFVRKLRFILPVIALVMTVVVLTWDEAGKRVATMKKDDVLPQSENIQNELLKPVFNSVDDKQQPYTVTADRAVQNKQNPDIVELEKPVASLQQTGGGMIDADATIGLYEQKEQKLNLQGAVNIKNDGYTLSTEELRVDMVTQKAYSGRDVKVVGPSGTLEATGLEGDAAMGSIVFTGPAKIILNSDGNLLTPKGNTP